VAAQLAVRHKPTLLIMDAPFNSVLDMGKKQVPWLPVSLLMKDKFQSDKALANLDVPLIWIHQNGQHTNLWFLGGREIVLNALAVATVV